MIDIREYIRDVLSVTLALSTSLIDIVAGFTAVLMLPYLRGAKWVLMIFPILLTVRGAINGTFSGTLTTSLHLGIIKPDFWNNTDEYYTLLSAIISLSIINGIMASIIVGLYLYELLLCIAALFFIIFTFALTTVFSILLTSLIGFKTFQYGLDPDLIVYPTMSSVNDVFASIVLLISTIILEPWNPHATIFRGSIFCLVIFILTTAILIRHGKKPFFKKTFKESYVGVLYSLLFSSASGLILACLYDRILMYPGILMAIPAVMTAIGDIGSIIASTTTTKLHLGEFKESVLCSIIETFPHSFSLVIAPYILFCGIYASLGVAITSSSFYDIFYLFLIFLISGLFGIALMSFLALLISFGSFKYGIDPDNVSIPIITATSDFIAISMIFVVTLII